MGQRAKEVPKKRRASANARYCELLDHFTVVVLSVLLLDYRAVIPCSLSPKQGSFVAIRKLRGKWKHQKANIDENVVALVWQKLGPVVVMGGKAVARTIGHGATVGQGSPVGKSKQKKLQNNRIK